MGTLRSRLGAAAFLTTIAIFAMLLPGPSEAAPSICQRLEAELASAGQAGTSPRLRQYEEAIVRQREQIAIMRDQADEAGCGYRLLGASVRQCARINAALERMGRNLEVLERNHNRIAAGGKKSRKQLLAEFEVNGCRDEEPPADRLEEASAPRTTVPEAETPYDRLLNDDAEQMAREPSPLPSDRADQTFRTMCVRTCDGFFFPMSNAATIGDFERDQKNCETACPGTDVRLFFGPSGSEGAAEMTSTSTGRPYSELPTAFLHQKTSSTRPASCGCRAKKDFEVIAGTKRPTELTSRPLDPPAEAPQATAEPKEQASAPVQTQSSIVTVPAPEPTASTNRPVEETIAPSGPEKTGISSPTPKPEDRKVRVVGPTFLPDQ